MVYQRAEHFLRQTVYIYINEATISLFHSL